MKYVVMVKVYGFWRFLCRQGNGWSWTYFRDDAATFSSVKDGNAAMEILQFLMTDTFRVLPYEIAADPLGDDFHMGETLAFLPKSDERKRLEAERRKADKRHYRRHLRKQQDKRALQDELAGAFGKLPCHLRHLRV